MTTVNVNIVISNSSWITLHVDVTSDIHMRRCIK